VTVWNDFFPIVHRVCRASSLTAVENPKTRIYVVDDHALFRRGLTALINATPDLEVCGEADGCAPATEGVSRLNPDVVVTDLILSGNNGLELIKNLRAMNRAAKIVVLSAHAEGDFELRTIKAGALAYISKRAPDGTIIEAIRSAKAGACYPADRIMAELLDCISSGRDFAADSRVSRLSDREAEVATLIGGGLGNDEIAQRLRVSAKTVAAHRLNIKAKLNLRSTVQLVHFCTRWSHESRLGPV
jgi:DNA-binding NarL/FixJ family response regulator